MDYRTSSAVQRESASARAEATEPIMLAVDSVEALNAPIMVDNRTRGASVARYSGQVDSRVNYSMCQASVMVVEDKWSTKAVI
jgi:hypothetical protein